VPHLEAEEDSQTLADCDQRALEGFKMLDAMEAEDGKTLPVKSGGWISASLRKSGPRSF